MGTVSTSPRFSCPSDVIDVTKLERETFRLLVYGFIVAICFHVTVGVYLSFKKPEKKIVKHITVELVRMPPGKTKPFVIREKGLRKKVLFRKEPRFRKPSYEIETRSLSIPDMMYREYAPEIDYEFENITDMLSDSLLIEERILRLPKEIIPLKHQVLFDTGEYNAEVIIPPDNKMSIQGYVHIALGCGEYLTPPDTVRKAIRNLADALNRYTNIYATADRPVYFFNPVLYRYPLYPFVYITSDKSFMLTEKEKWNLGHYIVRGGFVIIDNGEPAHRTNNAESSCKKMIRDVFKTISGEIDNPDHPHRSIAGKDYRYWYEFKPLRTDHDLFHCFFDFDNDPMPGYSHGNPSKHRIEGVYLGRRLIGLYVNGCGHSWYDTRNEAHLKMGVNLVVYALKRQKGYCSVDKRTGTFRWNYFASGPVKSW